MSQQLIFNVPTHKGSEFNTRFFYFISDAIQQIGSENQKWPDQILFIGKLGKELFKVIEDMGWEFSSFNPSVQNPSSVINKIVIKYSKPLDQIEEKGYINADTLHGKTMEGLPGPNTMAKLVNHSLNSQFKIERKVTPSLEIILKREN